MLDIAITWECEVGGKCLSKNIGIDRVGNLSSWREATISQRHVNLEPKVHVLVYGPCHFGGDVRAHLSVHHALHELGIARSRGSDLLHGGRSPRDPLHNSLRPVISRTRAVCCVVFLVNSGAIDCKKTPCSPSRSGCHRLARVMQRVPSASVPPVTTETAGAPRTH